jgi:hypothetical protein
VSTDDAGLQSSAAVCLPASRQSALRFAAEYCGVPMADREFNPRSSSAPQQVPPRNGKNSVGATTRIIVPHRNIW